MKTLLTFVFAIFIIAGAIAQEKTEEVKDGPTITFTEAKHDFGDIRQGDKVEHTFEFENTGTEPLIISNVQVTCGCTASKWPREPIPPGQASSITITFNSAGKMGRQNKIITIISNATDPRARISIVTNVLPKEDDTN
jgi:hypothetical protein